MIRQKDIIIEKRKLQCKKIVGRIPVVYSGINRGSFTNEVSVKVPKKLIR